MKTLTLRLPDLTQPLTLALKKRQLELVDYTIKPVEKGSSERDDFDEVKYQSFNNTYCHGHFIIHVIASNGQTQQNFQLLYKSLPPNSFLSLLESIIKKSQFPLTFDLEQTFFGKDCQHVHKHETAFYSLQNEYPGFKEVAPEFWFAIQEPESNYYAIGIEYYQNIVLVNDIDHADQWPNSYRKALIECIAKLHRIALQHPEILSKPQYVIPYHDSKTKQAATPLFNLLLNYNRHYHPELVDDKTFQQYQTIINTIPQWHAYLDEQPKVISNDDCNPRNMVLLEKEQILQGSIFDWEGFSIHTPQYDTADFLVNCCNKDMPIHEVLQLIDLHYQLLQPSMNLDQWRQGFYYCLYDLAINRIAVLLTMHEILPSSYYLRPFITLKYWLSLPQETWLKI